MASTLDTPVRKVIKLLVEKKFDELVRLTGGKRLDVTSIQNALNDYGRTLVAPPESAFGNIDIVEVAKSNAPRWSVRMNLWTIEEGMSDLSIELTLTKSGDGYVVELDDIRVL